MHTAAVLSIDASESLYFIVSGSADATVKIWSWYSDRLVKSFIGFSHWVVKVILKVILQLCQ